MHLYMTNGRWIEVWDNHAITINYNNVKVKMWRKTPKSWKKNKFTHLHGLLHHFFLRVKTNTLRKQSVNYFTLEPWLTKHYWINNYSMTTVTRFRNYFFSIFLLWILLFLDWLELKYFVICNVSVSRSNAECATKFNIGLKKLTGAVSWDGSDALDGGSTFRFDNKSTKMVKPFP